MAWTIFRRRERVHLADAHRAALGALVARARHEIIPLKNARAKAETLPAGAVVTVTASAAHGIDATLALAEWLQARQYHAVPHLSARLIRDRVHLTDVLERARAAGLKEAFVVGGDPAASHGLHDGLTLLRAMNEIGHPFDAVGVPAYPEGHPAIAGDVLLRALKAKEPYAQSMTTQMSFNAGAVSAWISSTRAAGVKLPLYLGVPGATDLTRLVAIAARIGVTGTARYLKKNRRLLGYLMAPGAFAPDAFLVALAPAMTAADADIAGLHLFTFNQVEETVAWQRRMIERLG